MTGPVDESIRVSKNQSYAIRIATIFEVLIGCMELLAGSGILRTHLGRHGAGPEDCPRREAALAPLPIAASYLHQSPIGARAMPASHVRPSIPDRRQGPCPLAMIG